MTDTPLATYDSRLSIHGTGEAVVLVPGLDGTGDLFYRQTPRLARSYRVATYALRVSATRDGYVGRLGMLRSYDVRDRLHSLQSATLFLASERDHLVPSVAQARYMVDRVPGAQMRVLERHGHICLIAPDIDLARILDEWRPTVR